MIMKVKTVQTITLLLPCAPLQNIHLFPSVANSIEVARS